MSAAVAPLADFVPPVRKLPHSIEAEMALLGGVMLSGKALDLVAEFLRPEHFALAEHRIIFAKMVRQRSAGRAVTEITLAAALENADGFAAVGGPRAYIGRLIDCAATVSNAAEFGRLIRELANRRAIIEAAEPVVADAYAGSASAADLLARLQGAADAIEAAEDDFPRLDRFDLGRWANSDPPELAAVIADLVPRGMVTLLVGEGGSGKSLLQQLALTCVASGAPFIGRQVTQGAAAGVFAEDPDAVLHLRQSRICASLGVDLAGLNGRLAPVSYAGRDSSMWRNGQPTALFRRTERELSRLPGLALATIDNAALVYADDENDRGSVTRFMAALNGLAARLNAAVMLSTHKAKSTDGTALRAAAGSTAWINAARAVLELKRGDEDGTATLELIKANHTQPGQVINLRWRDAVLTAEDGSAGGFVASLDKAARDRRADEVFLQCLREVRARGQNASDSTAARDRYAPKLFRSLEAGRALSLKDHAAAMARLFEAGRIKVEGVRNANRNYVSALVEVAP